MILFKGFELKSGNRRCINSGINIYFSSNKLVDQRKILRLCKLVLPSISRTAKWYTCLEVH